MSAAAVDPVDRIDDADVALGQALDHHRAGAVTKKNAGVAIAVVDDCRHDLAADHQHPPRESRLDLGAGGLHGEDEATAGGADVVTPGIARTQLILNDTSRGGIHHVRGNGGHENQIDVVGCQTSVFESLAGGAQPMMGSRRARLDDPPLLDPRPLDDPLVVGLDHRFEVFVGEQSFGEIHADAGDTGHMQRPCSHSPLPSLP